MKNHPKPDIASYYISITGQKKQKPLVQRPLLESTAKLQTLNQEIE
jgi:hypothetical protein